MDAEDFEAAKDILEDLRKVEAEKMYQTLNKTLKMQKDRDQRRSETSKLDMELDQSIAEEVIDTVVVALCLVATVAPLVWIGQSLELALSLMN